MSELNTGTEPSQPEAAAEKAGDLIRKERITRRIAVETIARDLKLNAKYIKSLEASDYSDLPADPYVRVYLRSIAKYLTLDPEAILKKFYAEKGAAEAPARDTGKLDVTMNSQKTKPNVPWPVIGGLVAVVFIMGVVASRIGMAPQTEETPAIEDSTVAVATEDSLEEAVLPDSVPAKPDSVVPSATAAKPATPAKDSVKTTTPPVTPKDTLRLSVSSSRDSVWVQIYSDGKLWKGRLLNGGTKSFIAVDSFNVRVGNNMAVTYTFNGKPLTGVLGNGIVTFKLDKTGYQSWPLTKWMQVFKNRG